MPRRVLQGTVVSDKMNKTVTVLVERRIVHPKYKKYVKKSAKYAAHDEANVCKTGYVVSIEECRPISKNKSWKVIEAHDEHRKPVAITQFNPDAVKAAAPAKEKTAAPKKAAAKKPAAKAK